MVAKKRSLENCWLTYLAYQAALGLHEQVTPVGADVAQRTDPSQLWTSYSTRFWGQMVRIEQFSDKSEGVCL
jgi:hypothetical protein